MGDTTEATIELSCRTQSTAGNATPFWDCLSI